MKIFFLRSLEGYLWSFPRPDHLSYGLITRAEPGWTSRGKALLSNFIEADLGSDRDAARGILQRTGTLPRSSVVDGTPLRVMVGL